MVDNAMLSQIINVVLVIASMYFGGRYVKFKKFVRDFANAIDDDDVTKEELKKMFNDIFGK